MTQEQEKKEYLQNIQNHTDRNLLEIRTYYARKTADYARSTNSAVTMIYYMVGFSFVMGILIGLALIFKTNSQ